MPHEPKKRHSRARQGKRRASIHLDVAQAIICKNCGNANLPHIVCTKCGYYKGQEVLKPKQKKPQPTA